MKLREGGKAGNKVDRIKKMYKAIKRNISSRADTVSNNWLQVDTKHAKCEVSSARSRSHLLCKLRARGGGGGAPPY